MAEFVSAKLAPFWSELKSALDRIPAGANNFSSLPRDQFVVHGMLDDAQDWRARLRVALEADAMAWWHRQSLRHGTALTLMGESELLLEIEGQQANDAMHARLGALAHRLDRAVEALAHDAGLPWHDCPWSVEGITRTFISTLDREALTPTLIPLLMRHYETQMTVILRGLIPELLRVIGDGESSSEAYDSPATHRPAAGGSGWQPEGGMVETLPTNGHVNDPVHGGVGPASAPAGDIGAAMPAANRGRESVDIASYAGVRPETRYRSRVHSQLDAWRRRARNGDNGGTTAVRSTARVINTSEVLTIASVLQGDDPTPFVRALLGQGDQPLPMVIRRELMSAAGQFGFDAEQSSFAEGEEDAVDLVAMLFDGLQRANAFEEPATRMMGKLVAPYVKVAVMDDSLFENRGHPARRLLDALVEACDGNTGDSHASRSMLERASQVVDQVVARFQESMAIFDLAARELQELLDRQRSLAEVTERRITETLQGQERLRQARIAADEAVGAALEGRKILPDTFHFLGEYWRNVLVQGWLRFGEQSPRYQAMRAVGDALLQMDADAVALRSRALAAGFEDNREAILEDLRYVGLQGEAAIEALARLAAGLLRADAAPGEVVLSNPPEPLADELPMQIPDLERRLRTVDSVLVARVRRLRAGQGLRIIEDGAHETMAKIAWVSGLTGRILVVNRRGERRMVVRPETLAVLVADGRVLVRSAEPPVDQVMAQVADSLGERRFAQTAG
ncbi:DUF1631 family protein [Solilutibacter silvestris]|uniref:DUF1631 family protein n=1 Tax=Solilutibacter silvestris TaxID=1645665 RepID=UPI0013FD2F6E|nr:DUF1631 family protein [Lysobacter silvestris]